MRKRWKIWMHSLRHLCVLPEWRSSDDRREDPNLVPRTRSTRRNRFGNVSRRSLGHRMRRVRRIGRAVRTEMQKDEREILRDPTRSERCLRKRRNETSSWRRADSRRAIKLLITFDWLHSTCGVRAPISLSSNTHILEHRYNEYKKVEALLKKDCAQAGCVSDALLDDTRRKLEETWIAMQGIQPYLKPIRVTSSSVMKSTSFSQENVRSVPLSSSQENIWLTAFSKHRYPPLRMRRNSYFNWEIVPIRTPKRGGKVWCSLRSHKRVSHNRNLVVAKNQSVSSFTVNVSRTVCFVMILVFVWTVETTFSTWNCARRWFRKYWNEILEPFDRKWSTVRTAGRRVWTIDEVVTAARLNVWRNIVTVSVPNCTVRFSVIVRTVRIVRVAIPSFRHWTFVTSTVVISLQQRRRRRWVVWSARGKSSWVR